MNVCEWARIFSLSWTCQLRFRSILNPSFQSHRIFDQLQVKSSRSPTIANVLFGCSLNLWACRWQVVDCGRNLMDMGQAADLLSQVWRELCSIIWLQKRWRAKSGKPVDQEMSNCILSSVIIGSPWRCFRVPSESHSDTESPMWSAVFLHNSKWCMCYSSLHFRWKYSSLRWAKHPCFWLSPGGWPGSYSIVSSASEARELRAYLNRLYNLSIVFHDLYQKYFTKLVIVKLLCHHYNVMEPRFCLIVEKFSCTWDIFSIKKQLVFISVPFSMLAKDWTSELNIGSISIFAISLRINLITASARWPLRGGLLNRQWSNALSEDLNWLDPNNDWTFSSMLMTVTKPLRIAFGITGILAKYNWFAWGFHS